MFHGNSLDTATHHGHYRLHVETDRAAFTLHFDDPDTAATARDAFAAKGDHTELNAWDDYTGTYSLGVES